MGYRRILVATDFSEASDTVIGWAGALAARLGAGLTVLHVYETPTDELVEPATPDPAVDQAVAAAALERLGDGIAAAGLPPGLEVEARVVRGTPWVQIVRLAEEGGFDLVVVGTHGRTGLAHLLLGSVAEKVVRKAPCPVTVVPPGTPVPA